MSLSLTLQTRPRKASDTHVSGAAAHGSRGLRCLPRIAHASPDREDILTPLKERLFEAGLKQKGGALYKRRHPLPLKGKRMEKIATLCPRTPWREASSSRAASGGAAGAGRLPGGGQAGRADSHGCAGPSIGRAGRPHRPPCSPQWHLSREGAVSQDPPRSHRRPACSAATSPHPRAGSLLRAGHTGARLSPPPPAAHSGHISSFPLSFLPELLRQVSPRARTMGKGGDRERGEEGEGAGFLSEGPRPPGKAARASLVTGGTAEPAEAVDAPRRGGVGRDRLRPPATRVLRPRAFASIKAA